MIMIRNGLFFSCLLALSQQSLASETLPRDVRNFIADREGCDHMRGEVPDPSDRQRMNALKQEMDQLCKGTDRKLAQLKKKYRAVPSVTKRLNEFDENIEPK
jgi:hypothetical protein